jgi:hypothetical protein
LRPVFARIEIEAQAYGEQVGGKKEIQYRILCFAAQNEKTDRTVKEEFCFHVLVQPLLISAISKKTKVKAAGRIKLLSEMLSHTQAKRIMVATADMLSKDFI